MMKVNYKTSILYRHSAVASCHFPRLLGKARGYVYVCEKVTPLMESKTIIIKQHRFSINASARCFDKLNMTEEGASARCFDCASLAQHDKILLRKCR